MDIEKVLTLVAVVVYGLVNIVLSIVRTLKTSHISSEVNSVLPSLNPNEKDSPSDCVTDDGRDEEEAESCSLDELISSLSDFIRKNYSDK